MKLKTDFMAQALVKGIGDHLEEDLQEALADLIFRQATGTS